MVDSFELSKIAGGVLAALLLIFLPKTFIDLARHSHGEIAGGYKLPEPSEAGGAAPEGGPAAPAAFDPAQVVLALPTASAENGAGSFKKCLACHSAEKGAASKAGPNLWGVLGRPHGSLADFKGYSDAMQGKGGDWTYADLAAFLHKPKEFVPGTKMIFAGISDTGELADVIAYIRTLADSPEPLPQAEAPAPQPEGAQPSAQPEGAPPPAQPESPASSP
ncbi:c-type cytochrome [Hyphomicrobium sp.]|uniref:c-type cytochrome n=1 Tax=Hyphomicrobium sp. TaxID=82 RepID=UPI0025BD3BC4|nr:c-type cytochrome [Hyphomicrobium sp.]